MTDRAPVIIHDLTFATRLARPTGVERVAINIFEASAAGNLDAVALVSDRTRVPAGLPVIEAGHYLSGWLSAYWRIPRELHDRAVMVCGCTPASPSLRASHIPIARVIADDFPWKRGNQMSLQGRILFRDYENWMLDRYDLIFTISDVAQAELRQTLGREVRVAGCATGIDPHAPDERPSGVADRPILLLVGTVEPRKNYAALARIVTPELLERWQVVVAGRSGWKGADEQVAAVERAHPGGLIWLRDASDAQLRWLYRHAGAFLTLSHAEGFNMPLVEAASHGMRVICSDLPIHRSVAPAWAEFVATDVDAATLGALLDRATAPLVPAEIHDYARRFSWPAVRDAIEQPLVARWRALHDEDNKVFKGERA